MKKLINWLIKLLHAVGLYTKKEYADVMDKWGKSLELDEKLYEIEENHLRIAESNVEYWCDKYTAEHENYLAMLSLYNTTVEQMQNGTQGVSGAIDTIKAYCKSKGSCDECALYNKNSGCKIHEIPCYWGE